MNGQCVLEGEVLARAAELSIGTGSRGGTASPAARNESALKGLSAREVDVVRAIADGMTNAEVAATLFMSEGTVRNHISSILAKLGLRNRTQIAVFYLRKCM